MPMLPRVRALPQESSKNAQYVEDADDDSVVVVPEHLRMAVSEKTIYQAAYAMIFCVFCDAIQLMVVSPNLPMMVTPGAHPESFTSTSPLDITSAYYVTTGLGKLGAVMSNLVFGYLADKFGSRKTILTLLCGSAILNLAKFFAQRSYWAFTCVTFLNGCFGASVTVANGYMCIIFRENRMKADRFIAYNMATMVAGRSLGGLFTVLFPGHLFVPLLPAVAVCAVGFTIAFRCVLLPGHLDIAKNDTCTKIVNNAPEKMDKRALTNVIVGALLDNIGSLGIVPLAFNPVMFQVFYLEFIQDGSAPVMNENQYRWLYSMIAVACLPAAVASPQIFKKIGPALACILANLFTAAIIVALLFTASINPITKGSFALYACILYVGFPLTVISNLSTAPMLDRLAPSGKKGFIQGISSALYDFGNGLFPIILAFVTDSYGWKPTLWICFGTSIVAAVSNVPLTFNANLKLQTKPDKKETRVSMLNLNEEEEEMQKLLKNVERVPVKKLLEINYLRALKGLPPLHSIFGTYSNRDIEEFGNISTEDIKSVSQSLARRINLLQDDEERTRYVQFLKDTYPDVENQAALKRELGDWVADYLEDNGYFLLMNAQLFKGWFIKSFPTINRSCEIDEEHVEEYLVNFMKFANRHLEEMEGSKWAKRISHIDRTKVRMD